MNDETLHQRKQKWEAIMQEYAVGASRLATYQLEAEKVLEMLGDKKEGRLLDIGCGFAEVDILLAKKSNFFITACDISDVALTRARRNVQNSQLTARIKIEQADVYHLPYPDNFFDVVTSFGYTSAATYKGVQGEVARVLKPGGLLICDFINLLCLYKAKEVPVRWRKLTREEGKYYNILTTDGIKKYFEKHNFYFISQRFFNTYPPVDFVSSKFLILFEKTIGRVLNRVLGRVRLVCFKKE